MKRWAGEPVQLSNLRNGGKAKFVYNVLGIHAFATEANSPVPAGHHPVRMEFAYDGGGLAKRDDVSLFHDGTPAGTGRVELTQPMVFSALSALALGSMPMSIEGRPEESRSIATIHAVLEAGITLIDTAGAYPVGADEVGHNESLTARAITAAGGRQAPCP